MVSHPKRAPDDFGDALAGPPIPAEAEGRRPLAQEDGNLRLLGGRETRWATGPRTLLQRCGTVAADLRQPLAHGSLAHTERSGDRSLSPAQLEQLPGPLPPAFPPGCCFSGC
jgi:hypothetical protein